MQKLYACIAVLVSVYSLNAESIVAVPRTPGNESSDARGSRWMKIGLASFAAGQALDMASSWHKRELNGFLGSPLPDGRCCVFDTRGLAIKAGLATALAGSFWLAGKAMPQHRGKFGKALTVMGLGSAALSFRNFSQPVAK